MKKAILAVSFGTTYETALERSVEATEKQLAEDFPDYDVYRAFTSGMVISALKKRGIIVNDVDEALMQLADKGYREVGIVPTHIICGEEYDKMCSFVRAKQDFFSKVTISKPLLTSDEDIKSVAGILDKELSVYGQPVILMGHGTEHKANETYRRFNEICLQSGFKSIFTATVEAKPDIDDVLRYVAETGSKNAVISPLMFVAGDHANNDMAGDSPESWKSRLEAAGYEVTAVVKGLGEYKAIRDIYSNHLRAALEVL